MTYTEKILEEFDIRKALPFTLGYAQRHPHEMESTVADKINAEVNYAITQAIAEDRERMRERVGELTIHRNNKGVTEIEENTGYYKASEIIASLDKPVT